jgi:hypothetical protein
MPRGVLCPQCSREVEVPAAPGVVWICCPHCGAKVVNLEALTLASPGDGWRRLRGWMVVLGVALLVLGTPALGLACCLGFETFWHRWERLLSCFALVYAAWAVTPVVAGVLVLRAARRLTRPSGESATSLVVAAASAIVGLAWVAVTVALMLGGGR